MASESDVSGPQTVRIPLANGRGTAIVDGRDSALAGLRWHRSKQGYAVRRVEAGGKKRTIYMHRVILGLSHDLAIEGHHRNGDTLDNRRCNLRATTRTGNMQNQRSHADATSQYRGVSWSKRLRKWKAEAHIGERSFVAGWFTSEIEAARAAEACRREHMPEAEIDASFGYLPECGCQECR